MTRRIPIKTISFNSATGDLRVTPLLPAGEDYSAVDRAARSARWDSETGELYTVEFVGRTAVTSYLQIVASVSEEYGDHLTITPQTQWIDVPAVRRDAVHNDAGSGPA